MSDVSEFESRFGVGLEAGLKNPDRPGDGWALYDPSTTARRQYLPSCCLVRPALPSSSATVAKKRSAMAK